MMAQLLRDSSPYFYAGRGASFVDRVGVLVRNPQGGWSTSFMLARRD
jgi:hypothetical protein